MRLLGAKLLASGPINILVAAFLCGVAGGIGGVLLSKGWDPIVLSLYRGLLTFGFGLLWLAVSPRNHGLSDLKLWGWSTIAGLGVAGAFSLYFFGMKHSGVAVAATLLYSAPVYVVLVSLFAGRERPVPGKALKLVLVIFGVALLSGATIQEPSRLDSLGIIAGLFSGACYAAFIFGFRNASRHGSPQAIMAIAFFVELCVLFGVTGNRAWIADLFGPDLVNIILLGLVGGGPSFLLYIRGLRNSDPVHASYTAMAEPVTAALFGLFVLGQMLLPVQVLGGLIVVITIANLRARQH